MAFRSLYLSQCDQKKDKDGALTNPQMIVLNVFVKISFSNIILSQNWKPLTFKKNVFIFFMSQSDDAFQCMSNY